MYTGVAHLDATSVLSVLYAASKYSVSGLCRACIDYVEEKLDVENACAVMEQAHLFEELDFRSRVLELILRKGERYWHVRTSLSCVTIVWSASSVLTVSYAKRNKCGMLWTGEL
ncbi:hypothetical protein C0Q70_19815 [Pomacea canaliculata]|uniref:BTB domain-containing protein n=1 Tax=Pomacea canaliculata TaxID=400727 RepID=A0A2T7NDS9_POMCA|nr:hypothetical protein C0Q70_19815 [Pomacea canaliculata]